MFKTVPGFKDADALAGQCLDKAEVCRKDAIEKRISDEKAAKKRKRIVAIVTSIIVACIAFVIMLTTVIIPNQQYQEARNAIKNSSVGSTIKFGHYEQDNNNSNGKEEIEWIVLAKYGDRILIISKFALDCQQYNTSLTSITWEQCSLRKWMNETFLKAAFNSGEQKLIKNSTVIADRNPLYSTSPGNNTTDKVFLLSITEVNKYFSSDSARQCRGTAYCYARGALKADNGNCWWWLRSPGLDSDGAACVLSLGSVGDRGRFVYSRDNAVRPALWINLGR
jgi:hypothetical protein